MEGLTRRGASGAPSPCPTLPGYAHSAQGWAPLLGRGASEHPPWRTSWLPGKLRQEGAAAWLSGHGPWHSHLGLPELGPCRAARKSPQGKQGRAEGVPKPPHSGGLGSVQVGTEVAAGAGQLAGGQGSWGRGGGWLWTEGSAEASQAERGHARPPPGPAERAGAGGRAGRDPRLTSPVGPTGFSFLQREQKLVEENPLPGLRQAPQLVIQALGPAPPGACACRRVRAGVCVCARMWRGRPHTQQAILHQPGGLQLSSTRTCAQGRHLSPQAGAQPDRTAHPAPRQPHSQAITGLLTRCPAEGGRLCDPSWV